VCVFKCTPCHELRRFRDVHALRMREPDIATERIVRHLESSLAPNFVGLTVARDQPPG